MRLIRGLSAGSHTFKLQLEGSAGVNMQSNAQFVVRGFRRASRKRARLPQLPEA